MTRSPRTPGTADRRSTGESGQALLELALVAPIIILLLMGLIQFALIYERQVGITNAVREAARRTAALSVPDAVVAQTNANWALGELQTLLGNSQSHEASRDTIEVCILTPASPDDVDVAGNAQIVVRISDRYRHPLWLPIVTQILDGIDGSIDDSLLASTEAEFRVEQPDNIGIGSGAAARFPAGGGPCTR